MACTWPAAVVTAVARASPSTFPVLLTAKVRPLIRMALPTDPAALSMTWPASARSWRVTRRQFETWYPVIDPFFAYVGSIEKSVGWMSVGATPERLRVSVRLAA